MNYGIYIISEISFEFFYDAPVYRVLGRRIELVCSEYYEEDQQVDALISYNLNNM
jgi:hypothetical protein